MPNTTPFLIQCLLTKTDFLMLQNKIKDIIGDNKYQFYVSLDSLALVFSLPGNEASDNI